MKDLFIDFETYFDREYSLRKLSTIEYVRDERFQVQCVAMVSGDTRRCYTGPEFEKVVRQVPWQDYRVTAHNASFDAFILSDRYGVKPGAWGCSMQVARAVLGRRVNSYSLNNLCEALSIGAKIEGALTDAKGKRLEDLTEAELGALMRYCEHDTHLCQQLYERLAPHLPESEHRLLDSAIRCLTEPHLQLDMPMLEGFHQSLEKEREGALNRCGHSLTTLRSRPKFAQALQRLGVEPPVKVSPTTGKETFAFAKDDEGFLELLEHQDERVRWLAQAKLVANGNNAITRAERLLRIGNPLPVPLLFWGAHTGRFSGAGSKINLQNLNRGSDLRRAIMAPPGEAVVCGDLSQVELRVSAALCNERLLLDELNRGDDVYCTFASRVYNREITKADETERFLGKTCQLGLGFGTAGKKLRRTLYVRSGGKVDLSFEEADSIVQLWRRTYQAIPEMWWNTLDNAIHVMAYGGKGESLEIGPLTFERGKVWLPNGTRVYYPRLRLVENEETGKVDWFYGVDRAYKLYGAKLLENIVQALARIQMTSAWLRLEEMGYKVRLTVHDELSICVPEVEAEQARQRMHDELVRTPDWLPNVPLEAEVAYAQRWGDAK